MVLFTTLQGNNVILFHAGKTYTLVEWEGEDGMSVVCSANIQGGVFSVGETAMIKTSEGTFRGNISDIGIYMY